MNYETPAKRRTRQQFVQDSSERMKALATTPDHPARTAAANARRSETRRRRHAEEVAWDREHPQPPVMDRFRRELYPALASRSAYAMASATGLSLGYCAQIKRGERVPHPRLWDAFGQTRPGPVDNPE